MFTYHVFLDFNKAFDTVNHTILLDKLHRYGIRGILHEWLSSYLVNRTQTTHIDNDHAYLTQEEFSNWSSTSVCFRPVLFLIYINDIYLCSNKLGFDLFADDTNLLYADKDLKSPENVVNTELKKNVCDWLNANKLSINAKKLNFVVFRPRQKRINHQTSITIPDNNNKGFERTI